MPASSSESLPPLLQAASLAYFLLLLLGTYVLWRHWIAPAWRGDPARLTPWPLSLSDFTLCLLAVLGGAFAGQLVVTAFIGPPADPPAPADQLLFGLAFQLGMLLAVAALAFFLQPGSSEINAPHPLPRQGTLLLGSLAFLAALPVTTAVGLAWQYGLNAFDYPIAPQEITDLLSFDQPPALLFTVIIMAVIVAPVTEELVFRAGLFRYLRTRIHPVLAYALPALIFALLHANLAAFLPLAVLGLGLAFVYERTGSILVPILAHAFFNLNAVFLLLTGLNR